MTVSKLREFASDLGLGGLRGLRRKEEIIDHLVATAPARALEPDLQPNWWKEHKTAVARWSSIVGIPISLAFGFGLIGPCGSDLATTGVEAAAQTGIFKAGSPFPRGFESIRPGMKLSVARSLLPECDDVRNRGLYCELADGPFEGLYLTFWATEYDPDIRVVSFRFRESTDAGRVRREAIRALPSSETESLVHGSILKIKTKEGFEITIEEDSYTIGGI